ncbi:ATP/GTP-binding protein [Fibrobacter sp. UWB11]|uniref:AAA family ATPase n=1 Tax=Fibrobacter sp. UWB11 TaxID=1896202 RepID=UPI00092B1DAB|nr:ATP-binding protein [Fibrobacter sp. UWB11]SIO10154.1 hypothetical protein SAMN05720758_1418 [Fibrobacter sp. UWB11]
MIQELKVRNYLSIKDEVRISFDASNDTFAEDYQVVKVNEQTRLLRFAVIYGYNASGKTNIFDAFCFLALFLKHKPESINEKTGIVPFMLDADSRKSPSFLELTFFVDDLKYKYSLEIDEKQVYLESLSVYNSVQPTLLFKRTLEGDRSKIEINPKLKVSKSAKEALEANCLKNMSFFVARDMVNGLFPFIDDAARWFKESGLHAINKDINLTTFAKKKIKKSIEVKRNALEMLKGADFNIEDIDIEEEFMPDELLKKVPVEWKKLIEGKDRVSRLKAIFHHYVENDDGKKLYALEEEVESLGTLRSLGLNVALYDAAQNESFLAIDEIENSLHPYLLQSLLYNFLKKNSKSQLFITTHYDGLLDLTDDLIRKDSVWFVEKNKAGESDFYKLTDFKGINRISSIRSAYRNKRFGATQFSVK